MKKIKVSELKIGDIVNVYQENFGQKIDVEVQLIQEILRPVKYDLGLKFYMICFKDTHTDGQNFDAIVLREDRRISLVTVQDQIKGAENYLIKSCGYSVKDLNEIDFSGPENQSDESYLKLLKKEINAIAADEWELIGEQKVKA
jgi:hypothetical protein